MGLFDAWQFDPRTYQPQAGLLDQIAQISQVAKQPSMPVQAAFPDNGPQPSMVIGSLGSSTPVPTFGQPDPSQLPQNAKPAQYTQPAQAETGFADRLLASLQGLGEGARTGGLVGAITGGAQGAITGLAPQNQTVKALVAKGLDPAIAQSVARDPASMRALLPTLLGGAGLTDDIKEYNFAKREDPTLTFAKFMQQKKAVSGEYSLTPQYGTNDKGETVLIQTGKSGTAIQTKLPDNVQISSGTDKIDLGTQWAIINKRDGSIIGYQPKDVAGAASQKAQGTAQGEATVALPGAIQQAEDALKTIQQTREHPGRQSMFATGGLGWVPGIPGTDQKGFVTLVDQLKGRAFLQAYASLKGTGSISEVEGLKAEQAQARLDRAQSKKDFDTALDDLESIVTRGLATARAKAGQQAGAAATPAPQTSSRVRKFNPATGRIE